MFPPLSIEVISGASLFTFYTKRFIVVVTDSISLFVPLPSLCALWNHCNCRSFWQYRKMIFQVMSYSLTGYWEYSCDGKTFFHVIGTDFDSPNPPLDYSGRFIASEIKKQKLLNLVEGTIYSLFFYTKLK